MSNQYDDSAKGGYTYEEKLGLVAQGGMDPKTIGLSSAEDAKNIILGQDKPEPKLGDFFALEASVVPIALRARWARQDLKIQPENPRGWEADWCEQHKNEHSIQSQFRCGSMAAVFGQTYTDPILGFIEIMRKAATLLEVKYAELKANDPYPIITRDEVMKRLAEETLPNEEPISNDSSAEKATGDQGVE